MIQQPGNGGGCVLAARGEGATARAHRVSEQGQTGRARGIRAKNKEKSWHESDAHRRVHMYAFKKHESWKIFLVCENTWHRLFAKIAPICHQKMSISMPYL